ncbi:protein-lysine N-methyltransferase EEF2KMT-like [Haliotis cracherodii]|uniref:protein-lysine N-methyltransferase EEF2KMT-like n=1 Tax=Haliotis rufescens TaxID=6454 RepID=UPI001EB03535|nr:protein-lysine N-methyltransferase EEF2KMT-like [Haliotis rufescens]
MAASCEENQNAPCREEMLRELSSQFLEMVPVRRMKLRDEYADSLVTYAEGQRRILQSTILHPVCRVYPPSLSYRRYFMKQLIHRLEDYPTEVCDEVYEAYTDLLGQQEEEDDTLCYKTYTLPLGDQISLQESVHLVSQGTTGLSTWQAAQHLAEWVFENQNILQNRNVLELGSGLGLTGVAVCRHCGGKLISYTFSDCHPQVLYMLARNIELNLNHNIQKSDPGSDRDKKILRKIRRQLSLNAETGLCDTERLENEAVTSPTRSEEETNHNEDPDEIHTDLEDLELSHRHWKLDETGLRGTLKKDDRIRIAKLDWECVSDKLVEKLKPDVILAADVVFDTSIIPALVSLLRQLLTCTPDTGQDPVAYITSTVRNEDTRDCFLIALGNEGLAYSIMEPPTTHIFHYDRSVPIEIVKIFVQ